MKMVEYKKIISATAVIGAIVILATIFYVYTGGSNIKTAPQAQNLGFERLEQHMAVGTVEKIFGKEIVLKDTKKMPDNTISVDQAESIVVTVDQTTVIERFVQKDVESIKNDLADFAEKQKQGTATATIPPEPFTRTKVTFDDIKIGDTIVVFSPVDIAKLTTFVATEINIQPVVGGDSASKIDTR